MDTANFKKRYTMIPLLFLCLLLCGCHGNIIGNLMASEHTELLVDGEYKPFNVPRNTMEALMKLVEAKNADTIYEVFSPEVRENAEGLYGQVQEFIRFIEEEVTSWDFLSDYGNGNRSDGSVTMTRASFYEFSTDSGIYRCDIGEVLKDTVQLDLVGFSDITVYPGFTTLGDLVLIPRITLSILPLYVKWLMKWLNRGIIGRQIISCYMENGTR